MPIMFPPPSTADFDATIYYRIPRTANRDTLRSLSLEPGEVVMSCQSGGDSFLMTAGKRVRIATSDVSATLAVLVGAGALVQLEDAP